MLVDREDQDLSALKWYVARKVSAVTFLLGYQKTRAYLALHRVICERVHGVPPQPRMLADHINRDPTDCRRQNLRWVTYAQSNWNRRGSAQAGYKGVYSQNNCKRKRFKACIEIDGHNRHLGGFETVEEAALAYDAAARKYGGVYAFLNFPDRVS